MARILLLANLNSDHVLKLKTTLSVGQRHIYEDQGKRLGGGGANTGIGLVWAQHDVALMTQVGDDDTADWLIAQASGQGLDCRLVQRYAGSTPDVLLLTSSNGERTIMRPSRPSFPLPETFDFTQWDVVYVNIEAQGLEGWLSQALDHTCIVYQMKHTHEIPACHYLIGSKSELPQGIEDYWSFAANKAGASLKAFIVTNSEQGATAYTAAGSHHVPSVNTKQVIDTTGAGDVYAGGLISALMHNKPLEEAMLEAAHWAANTLAHEVSIPHTDLKAWLARSK